VHYFDWTLSLTNKSLYLEFLLLVVDVFPDVSS
jgi:hypothetical protein